MRGGDIGAEDVLELTPNPQDMRYGELESWSEGSDGREGMAVAPGGIDAMVGASWSLVVSDSESCWGVGTESLRRKMEKVLRRRARVDLRRPPGMPAPS